MFRRKAKFQTSAKENDSHVYYRNDSNSSKDEKQRNNFEVYFLGIVPEIVMNKTVTRDREAQLVDRIEEAQIEGRLPMSGQGDEKVKINVSIHGIKVKDLSGLEVLQRHPLHTIAQVVQYSDGGRVNNVVFKIGNVNKPVFSAYVFQCLSEGQAGMICNRVRDMFDEITDRR